MPPFGHSQPSRVDETERCRVASVSIGVQSSSLAQVGVMAKEPDRRPISINTTLPPSSSASSLLMLLLLLPQLLLMMMMMMMVMMLLLMMMMIPRELL